MSLPQERLIGQIPLTPHQLFTSAQELAQPDLSFPPHQDPTPNLRQLLALPNPETNLEVRTENFLITNPDSPVLIFRKFTTTDPATGKGGIDWNRAQAITKGNGINIHWCTASKYAKPITPHVLAGLSLTEVKAIYQLSTDGLDLERTEPFLAMVGLPLKSDNGNLNTITYQYRHHDLDTQALNLAVSHNPEDDNLYLHVVSGNAKTIDKLSRDLDCLDDEIIKSVKIFATYKLTNNTRIEALFPAIAEACAQLSKSSPDHPTLGVKKKDIAQAYQMLTTVLQAGGHHLPDLHIPLLPVDVINVNALLHAAKQTGIYDHKDQMQVLANSVSRVMHSPNQRDPQGLTQEETHLLATTLHTARNLLPAPSSFSSPHLPSGIPQTL